MSSAPLQDLANRIATNTLTPAQQLALLTALDSIIPVFPNPDELSNSIPPFEETLSRLWYASLYSLNAEGGPPLPPVVSDVTGVAPIVVTDFGSVRQVSITAATDAAPGSLSAADKTKLDGLSATPINSITATAPLTRTAGQNPTIALTPGQFGLTTPVAVAPDNIVPSAATFLAAMPLVPKKTGLYQVSVTISYTAALVSNVGGNLYLLDGPVVVSGGSAAGTVGGLLYNTTASPLVIAGETGLHLVGFTAVQTTVVAEAASHTLTVLVQAPVGLPSALAFFFTSATGGNTLSNIQLGMSAIEIQ